MRETILTPISAGELQWPVGQGGLFFDQEVVLLVVVAAYTLLPEVGDSACRSWPPRSKIEI
jgi:hypothetical protein